MPIINKYQDNKRLKIIANICNSMKINQNEKLNLLDIGYAECPNKYLDFDMFNVTGVDIQSNRTNFKYQNEIIMDVTSDNLQELGLFDIIIGAEFIEHIENPYSFLSNLHHITKPNTKVILSTPNPLGFPIIFLSI